MTTYCGTFWTTIYRKQRQIKHLYSQRKSHLIFWNLHVHLNITFCRWDDNLQFYFLIHDICIGSRQDWYQFDSSIAWSREKYKSTLLPSFVGCRHIKKIIFSCRSRIFTFILDSFIDCVFRLCLIFVPFFLIYLIFIKSFKGKWNKSPFYSLCLVLIT